MCVVWLCIFHFYACFYDAVLLHRLREVFQADATLSKLVLLQNLVWQAGSPRQAGKAYEQTQSTHEDNTWQIQIQNNLYGSVCVSAFARFKDISNGGSRSSEWVKPLWFNNSSSSLCSIPVLPCNFLSLCMPLLPHHSCHYISWQQPSCGWT